jgi:hypothetical protein
MKEYAEMIRQTEMDYDLEIEVMTKKYDAKLQVERDEYAKLKGENGIMNKKFSTLIKEIEDHKMDAANYKENAAKLHGIIAKLDLVRSDLKKDVRSLTP